MKKTLLATTLATITLISASSAFAADTVDLKVGGSITPAACIPSLSGGGAINYGDFKAKILAKDNYSRMGQKELDFTITCSSLTKLALTAVNGRIGSLAGATEDPQGGADSPVVGMPSYTYGLGLANGKKIGGYSLRLNDITYDGKKAAVLSSYGASNTWKRVGGSDNDRDQLISINGKLKRLSWAAPGTDTPIAFRTLAGKLEVEAFINKGSELDLTSVIKLDGQTTLELTYL